MDTLRKQIKDSIKQLSDLGYHDFQINNIIKDAVSNTILDNLSKQETSELLIVLREYLRFAVRCHMGSKQPE